MGIYCHMAEEMSDDCFFIRHGKRVYDRSRFQLDYRNPKVREYADCVIDRIVSEYGVGYIKMDYNIEPGIGTELNADSFGDGLLEHERSYLNWLDQVWKRYPDLVIENCSSGGLRMDYAMLSRYSIQSTSDQDDYRLYATIAANAPTAVTPEQAAVWAYPMNHEGEVGKEELQEETVFNMINSMLLRIHQSGHLAKLDEERKSLVKEGISVYKEIRKDIAQGFPFWPIGLSQFKDEWSSLGIQCDKVWYLAVWRRSGSQSIKTLPVQELKKRSIKVSRVYPAFGREPFEWNSNVGQLTVEFLRENMARLYRLELE
jgi:alpha-galactosidase